MSQSVLKRIAAFAVALVIVGVLAWSFADADAQGTSGTPAAASPAASPMAGNPVIDLKDIKFDPREVTIAANTDVTIELDNLGAAVHNFNIDALNIHSGDITPGGKGSVKINAKPGDYTYYCNIPGHKDAGMVGVLHVK